MEYDTNNNAGQRNTNNPYDFKGVEVINKKYAFLITQALFKIVSYSQNLHRHHTTTETWSAGKSKLQWELQ